MPRILFIDDQPDVRALICIVLQVDDLIAAMREPVQNCQLSQ